MGALQQALKSFGYNVPGFERVDRDYTTEVRYFHDFDAELAAQTAGDVAQFLADKCGVPAQIPNQETLPPSRPDRPGRGVARTAMLSPISLAGFFAWAWKLGTHGVEALRRSEDYTDG